MDRNELRLRQNAREHTAHERLQRVLEEIVKQTAKPEFTRLDGLMEAEGARMVALSLYPPRVDWALQATRLKCDLMGLIVSKQALAVGKPQDFPQGDTEEAILERLRERLGPEHAERFMELVDNLQAAMRGDVIDGEAEEVTDGQNG